VYKFPDLNIELNLKTETERIIFYRRFLAEMRLNRLYFHSYLLKFFLGIYNQEEIISLLKSNISFLDKIMIWTNDLKENGNYEEFKKACNDEMDAIEKIIRTYEMRMNKDSQNNKD
jgi:hypothetical protein